MRQPGVGGRALSAVLKEAPKPLGASLLPASALPPLYPSSLACSLSVPVYPFLPLFYSLFAPFSVSMTPSQVH